MVAALAGAGAAAGRITPLFITVDPGRDNAANARAAMSGCSAPRLVGLGPATRPRSPAVIRAYRVYVETVPPASPGAPYLVNHSAFMYLMNPAGKLAAIFPPDVKTADLAHQLAADTSGSPAS